ncbi:uncharacterized protein LOC110984673 isoform X2 [Acanthaster planci]|uniref:Uncharacterized protein LOC110984673 isoform X2 n=1 Tax=Acanthaster planci TaxID=133434 RepID=A0A8B7ZC30_ACAPL|nr:uncharacterized protein LOC110984673 isoform X2 [Acanthaster planci]
MQSAMSEVNLRYLASNLGKEWRKLASYLQVRKDEIDRIQADHQATEEQIFQMLILWWQRQDHSRRGTDDGALNALCTALRESGRPDLISNFRGSTSHDEDWNVDLCRAELIRFYGETMGKVPLLPWVSSDVSRIVDIFGEIQLMESRNKTSRVVQRKLSSYAEMLMLTEFGEDQPVTHILLYGVAGCGKTTLVSMIAYDWALQKPGSPLAKFRLLFTINLRDLIKGTPTLMDAVYDQLLPEDTMVCQHSLRGYLHARSKEVLVIMDGFDETGFGGSQISGDLVKIIGGKILQGCTVIVTTRPYMVEPLNRLNPNFTRIESKGFSDDAVQLYIQRFFQDEDDSQVSVGLCRVINEYDNLLDIVRLPIMLLITCLIWSEDRSLPRNITEAFREAAFFILRRHFKKSRKLDSLDDEFIDSELKELIKDLGKAALDGLMLPGEKLVFEPTDFGNTKAVDKACQIGILSQERTRSKLRAVQNVTFIHKTFQEAIAGFYLAQLAETDHAFFSRHYLKRICKDNVHSLKDVLRFSSGASVNAAKILLAHVVSNDVVQRNEETFALFLLMLLESRCSELHSTAAPLLAKDGLYFTFTCSVYQKSAFEFFVECASQSPIGDQCGKQSVFMDLKRLVLLDVTREDAALVNSIFKCALSVSEVVLGLAAVGKLAESESVLRPEDYLCETLCHMPLLENLCLFPSEGQGVCLSRQLDLSVIVGRLATADISSLRVFVLQSVSAGPRQIQEVSRRRANPSKSLTLLGGVSHKARPLSCRDATHGQDTERKPPRLLLELEAGFHRVESISGRDHSVPGLRSIQLLHNDRQADLQPVSSLLSRATNLEVVDLSRLEIGTFFSVVSEPLSKLGKLKELLLSETGLSSDDVMLLTQKVLPFMANLEILSLSHNNVARQEALLAVVRWACSSTCLTELFLGGCVGMLSASDELSTACVRDTVDAKDDPELQPFERTEVLQQRSVEVVDVQTNYLHRYTPDLIGLLKHFIALRTINMSSMGLTDSDIVELAGVVTACTQLEMLHLEGNEDVGNTGVEALLRLLPQLPNIRHLCLPFDDTSERYSDIVSRCLKRRSMILGCYTLSQEEIQTAIQIVKG